MKQFFSFLLTAISCQLFAQNPVVQTQCTTDPAPFVHNDTLYVYTGHDEDNADFFWMQEWRTYSTTDMVNWTDHGSPLAIEDFQWADDRAWAPQLIERNGKFYFYVPLHSKLTNTMAIGVAVGDSPTGPFKDALGKPLYEGSWDYIDPTVLIDDDGRAYLYWGNPKLYYCELNDDMISIKGEVKHCDPTLDADGKAQDKYTEGPWIMKRNNLYYMIYAAGGVPEHIAYSTSEKPLGPWTYRGIIMPQSVSNKETGAVGTDSFTSHVGTVDYKGHSYFFYHTGWIGGGFGRSIAVEEFKYNADGTFPIINPTREGITNPLGTLNPYLRVEAETMAFSKGLKAEQYVTDNAKGYEVYISDIHNGDWLKLRNVDFGAKAARQVLFRASSAMRGGQVEMHLDSIAGECIATVNISGTGGWERWQEFRAPVSEKATGVHDLYLVFKGRKGPKLFNLDYWQLSTEVPNPWMWSDVPDPDIIRVGEYYYLVSTTMHLMPGGPIMRSRDLVNWETVSYLFDQIKDTPRYDLTDPEGEGTVYGRGQWATSIRYHNGTFWALFSANDAPHKSCLYRTDDPAKGWVLHSRLPHFHDCSLFFDDDDRCYVFSGSEVRVVELNETLTDVKEGGLDVVLNNRKLMPEGLLEGSRVIKHDGYYYLLMISWPSTGRQQLAFRSKNIEGPYEMKTILKSEFGGFPYVGQGTIVDGKAGEWYGVIFQDRNGVGRVLTLSPCKWVDGWPIIGDEEGKVPETMPLFPEKPLPLNGYIGTVVSDEFDGPSDAIGDRYGCLGAWQWNHNPVMDKWSLTERPGFLRLHTVGQAKSLYHALNTLTQRMDGPECVGEVCLDIANLAEGDRAGFAAYNGHSGILTIERNAKGMDLVLSHEEVTLNDDTHAITNVDRAEVKRIKLGKSTKVWLRITGDFRPGHNDTATFWYSLDGKKWSQLGGDYNMRFDYRRLFMGTKFAIFCYSTTGNGGFVDVDWFHAERN